MCGVAPPWECRHRLETLQLLSLAPVVGSSSKSRADHR